jgi:hypothetical protein
MYQPGHYPRFRKKITMDGEIVWKSEMVHGADLTLELINIKIREEKWKEN